MALQAIPAQWRAGGRGDRSDCQLQLVRRLEVAQSWNGRARFSACSGRPYRFCGGWLLPVSASIEMGDRRSTLPPGAILPVRFSFYGCNGQIAVCASNRARRGWRLE